MDAQDRQPDANPEANGAEARGAGAWLLFAPSQDAGIVVAMAAEFGIERVVPVRTENEGPHWPTRDLEVAARRAARRAELTDPPRIDGRAPLFEAVRLAREDGRTVLFCDESGDASPLAAACAGLPPARAAVLVGPREGFTPAERKKLRAESGVVPVSLGPRALGPEAAAVAAAAVVQQMDGRAPKGAGAGLGKPA